jgi:hypothetical protein
MRKALETELKAEGAMAAQPGGVRAWLDALNRIAQEEGRRGGGKQAIRWRSKREAITVAVDVINPLNVPVPVQVRDRPWCDESMWWWWCRRRRRI